MKLRIPFTVFLFITILQAPLFAKRAFIEYPDKLISGNTEYRASYDFGRTNHDAYIEARGIVSNAVVWKIKIYSIRLDPALEQDVQWVMITGIKEKNGRLIISNEKKQFFSLDLKSGEVKKIE